MAVEVGAIEKMAIQSKLSQQVAKQASATSEDKIAKAEQIVSFLTSVKAEFKKIVWTDPTELRSYTKIVVAMTVLLGLGIYVMDLFIQFTLGSFEFILRLFGA